MNRTNGVKNLLERMAENWRVRAATLALLVNLMPLPSMAGSYDGPPVDVNFGAQRPAKYAECDQYMSDSNARRYAACEFGRDEAERMADRYGGGHGRVDGYLRGYSWALYKNADIYEDDANEQRAGERLADGLGNYFQAGIAAGERDGRNQGASQGRQDAIARFMAVLDTGRNPDNALRVPQTNYQGEDNAYTKYVGAVPSKEEIMQKELNLDELPIYHDRDALYLGDVQPVNPWALLFSDGVYAFEKLRWYDRNRADESWVKIPTDTKPKYNNLNNPPLLDAAGQPIDLQVVFHNAFKNSYDWYINYYYSSKFHENLEMGTLSGAQVGQQLGKRVAQYRGMVAAFNRKFKESSALSFRNAYVGAYTEAFNATYADYANNPKLSIRFLEVIGADADGILQPGEQIAVKFQVKNVGGVGAPLQATVGGDVLDAKAQAFQIGKLQTQVFTTALIAQLDPRLQPRQTARLVLNVNGITDSLGQTVQKMIELANPRLRIDVSNGAGEIVISATNVATVRTPGIVTATLKIGARDVITQPVGTLEAGNTVEVVLPFASLDPLAIIGGQLGASVTAAMNGTVTDASAVSLAPANSDLALVAYLDALANGRGFVPGGVSREGRTSDVVARIASINDDETKRIRSEGPNVYRKSPEVTMAGKVVAQFKAAVQTPAAKDLYHALGAKLFESAKNLKKFLFIKLPKRAAYEKLVKQLSKTGKY